MGTRIRQHTAGQRDVYGIRHLVDVVVGDVAGTPVDGLRLLNTRGLYWHGSPGVRAAGHLKGNKRCLRPAAASAPWTP
jgi:hypothetical protein